jgi:hypothetical protein
MSRIPTPSSELGDPFDVTSLAFEPGEDSGKGAGESEGPFSSIPTRDVFITPAARSASPQPPAAASVPVPEPPAVKAAAPAPPPAEAEAAPAPAPEAPPAAAASADDLEETQSLKPSPSAPPEPIEEAEGHRDLFAAGPPPLPDLPEPPPLFISPAAAARAGEIDVPSDGPAEAAPTPAATASLEPREFPPPYEPETGAQPAAAAAESTFGDDTEAIPDPGAAPSGRALADLYYAQGHYAEALQIYDDLVTRHPFDADLQRMRRDAEARLLPAASAPTAATADPGLERRLARVRILKRWLGRIQESGPSAPTSAPGP